MKKIEIDFFKNVKFLSQLKSKGGYLSYIVSETNMEDDRYDANIYLYDLKEEKHRQLTSSNKEQSYFWLNEDEIIFASSRDDDNEKKVQKTILYKINIHGGEAKRFIVLPYKVKKIEMVDENSFLFTSSCNEDLDKIKTLEGHEKQDYISKLEEDDDYEVIEEIPFWSNGGTYSRNSRTALYFYNILTDDVKKISEDKFNVTDFIYEKEFNQSFVIGNDFIGKSEIFNKILKVNLDEFSLENISHSNEYSYRKFIQVSNDELIVYGTDSKEFGLNENGKFGLLNTKNNSYKLLTPNFVDSTSSAVGSDLRIGNASSPYYKDETGIYFIVLDVFTNKVMHLSFEGELNEIKKTKSCVDEYVLAGDEIYFIGLMKNSPQEIYKLEGLEKLSNYNKKLLTEYDICTPDHLTFVNSDNVLVDGFVIKPSEFDENKRYPVILNIHGGPKTAYGDVLYHEMQYWANEGYGVIYCNPRGSDGKGSEFADIRGKYGTIDYNDIMDFVDVALNEYKWIDEEKLGVTGGSYGGFMTNWIIGHTDRFKAAASQRSISNWIGFFGTSDIGYYFAPDQVAATPWSDVDKMWEQSPLKFADQVSTPTLFTHSQNDYRCWTPESYQMFTALKYFGVESRLVLFSDENHELSRSGKPKHRIRRLKEITNWMDKYLK